jgi:GTPase Era involved in 16S rRNA processing
VDIGNLAQDTESDSAISSDLAEIMQRVHPYLLLNKVDSLDRPVGPLADEIKLVNEMYGAVDTWAISLRTGANVDRFLKELGEKLNAS